MVSLVMQVAPLPQTTLPSPAQPNSHRSQDLQIIKPSSPFVTSPSKSSPFLMKAAPLSATVALSPAQALLSLTQPLPSPSLSSTFPSKATRSPAKQIAGGVFASPRPTSTSVKVSASPPTDLAPSAGTPTFSATDIASPAGILASSVPPPEPIVHPIQPTASPIPSPLPSAAAPSPPEAPLPLGRLSKTASSAHSLPRPSSSPVRLSKTVPIQDPTTDTLSSPLQWLLRTPRRLQLRDGGFKVPFDFAVVPGSQLPPYANAGDGDSAGDAWRWCNKHGGTVGFVRLNDIAEVRHRHLRVNLMHIWSLPTRKRIANSQTNVCRMRLNLLSTIVGHVQVQPSQLNPNSFTVTIDFSKNNVALSHSGGLAGLVLEASSREEAATYCNALSLLISRKEE